MFYTIICGGAWMRRKLPKFNEEWAERIVDEHVGAVCFNRFMIPDGAISTRKIAGYLYVVVIDPNYHDDSYNCGTFIHELIHIFDFVCGRKKDERRVERRGLEFVEEHYEFALNLFKRVQASNKFIDLREINLENWAESEELIFSRFG